MRYFSMIVFALCLMFLPACAHTGVDVDLQTQVAHHGADILKWVREGQEQVISLQSQKAIPNDVADKAMKAIDKAIPVAERLSTSLKTFDAATKLDLKQIQAEEIQKLLTELEGTLGDALNFQVPPGTTASATELLSKVKYASDSIRAEIAKFKAAGQEGVTNG